MKITNSARVYMEQKNIDYKISITKTVLLLLIYILIISAIPALIDIALQNIFGNDTSVLIDTIILILVNIIFFVGLARVTHYKISFSNNITVLRIMLSIACAFLLYLLLDSFLDPIFNNLFPASEIEYQEMLKSMQLTPITTFIQVSLLAPITEEMLMRGYILQGLKNRYSVITAILVSTLLFAILHVNIGQILSAFIGGLILATLYLKTKSIFCCILTHVLYNSILYFTTII